MILTTQETPVSSPHTLKIIKCILHKGLVYTLLFESTFHKATEPEAFHWLDLYFTK